MMLAPVSFLPNMNDAVGGARAADERAVTKAKQKHHFKSAQQKAQYLALMMDKYANLKPKFGDLGKIKPEFKHELDRLKTEISDVIDSKIDIVA